MDYVTAITNELLISANIIQTPSNTQLLSDLKTP